jgi:serine/threonine-protein kinase
MYMMFANQAPYLVDTIQKIYQCHLQLIPENPNSINPQCPRELGDIILKLMAKKPEDRFKDCDVLRIVLGDIGKSRI